MIRKIRDYLELVRIPNVFTALADILAGFLYASGLTGSLDLADQWSVLCLLGISSACLYSAGIALNDVCDAAQNSIKRPTRPIPSGRVSRQVALSTGLVLFSLGIIAALRVSVTSLVAAVALMGAIILYDALLKHSLLGPAVMGICRGLNLLLGMTAMGRQWGLGHVIPTVFMWLYVTALTTYARRETNKSKSKTLKLATLGTVVSVLGLNLLYVILEQAYTIGALGTVILAAWLGHGGWRDAAIGTPQAVQSHVKRLILSIVLFDGVLVLIAVGTWPALAVVSLFLLAVVVGRLFPMT